MYEYLVGCFILSAIWSVGFVLRKDLRRPMIWSGLAYIIVSTVLFVGLRTLAVFGIGQTITPNYWNPKTLFNLALTTGGYGIEDVLFMFFIGGVATFVYELALQRKIKVVKSYKHHLRAPLIGVAAALLFEILFKANWIYALAVFGFAAAASIWIESKNLIGHSLLGGMILAIVYFAAFVLFNQIFPGFIQKAYNFQNISGILILGVPLEELLYAFSFGLAWSPIYEYEHGEKTVKI
ncbi:MAG: hypothetical protein HY471_00060 [Candidatus Sungbacteria bacterium]|nr:hypothetical protein [Candidatus Sungbacteria bacterium]